jgi:hypothetical protein
MLSSMGPIDIECDAPFYCVVEACGKLGFQSPLDVRWCRISNFVGGQVSVGFRLLRWLFGGSQFPETTCSCGQPLPAMKSYTCVFESAKEGHYLLGQCRRCRTMFWEEASVSSQIEIG